MATDKKTFATATSLALLEKLYWCNRLFLLLLAEKLLLLAVYWYCPFIALLQQSLSFLAD